jgi:hypothetical protein
MREFLSAYLLEYVSRNLPACLGRFRQVGIIEKLSNIYC